MTTVYSAPQLLMEVGKKIRFVSGYSRINEFTGLQFTYGEMKYQVCHGYIRTNGQNDFPAWEGVALLFVSGSHYLKQNLQNSRFHVLHQVSIVYVVHSNRLETEGELISEVIDNLFGDKNYFLPVEWIRDVYPHEVIVMYDPPLIWKNHGNNNICTAFPLFITNQDHINTRQLKEYLNETYKKHTAAEDEAREFSVNATEFSSSELMKAPQYSDGDVGNFLRILDRWITVNILHIDESKVGTVSE